MARDFESRVRDTGRRIFKLIEGEAPSAFNKQYWTGKVMDWCMRDEAFKVEMLRFVDVFPYLTRPESVAQHLIEYFCRPEQDFPAALQWGLRHLSPTSKTARWAAKTIAKNIATMGQMFIAGATAEQASPELDRLRQQGFAFTADLLGEAVVSEAEADAYAQRYVILLDQFGSRQHVWPALGGDQGAALDWGWSPKINLSIKPSAMYSQMKARAFEHSLGRARERLRPILRKAITAGAHVCLDMEHTALKNLTLALFRSLLEEPEFRGYPHVGIVIQAYLRDSADDLEQLIKWGKKAKQPFTVRLVKGAYWDAETVWAGQNNWPVPVYTAKHATDANFEATAHLLLKNHKRVGFACASHNIRSIAYVMEMAKDLRVPPEGLEYQILYGMAEPVRTALLKMGLPLRLYAPIGEMIPGMAYLVRRLLENTSNEAFLRLSFAEGVAVDELLQNPQDLVSDGQAEDQSVSRVKTVDPGVFRNEPTWDWTEAQHCRDFGEALTRMRKRFPLDAPLFINGADVRTGRELDSTNPNNAAQVVGRVALAGKPEADQAIAAAKAAFPRWRDTDPAERARYLCRAAQVMRGRRHDLAALQLFEEGKGWDEADGDVCEAIDFLEFYAREMLRLARPQRMGAAPGEDSKLFYEPRGVTAVIAPWNFPLAISTGMTSAALVAGNTVIYKPSSQSAVIGHAMVQAFREAKLPPGVLNYLPGSGAEIGDHLVTHPDVAMIAFTGSMEVGLRINEIASQTPDGAMQVKRVVAEMGGKNAIIVDADADLDEAVVHALKSAFGYQGQKCSACSRLIVLAQNYDKLVRRLEAAAQSLQLGPVEDPRTVMGAVIDAKARAKILEYIEIGKQEGQLLVSREIESSTEGHFVPLTIFTDVQSHHRLAQEEIFGPVLAVIKVEDFSEALRVANSTRFALTGGLFSRSPFNIEWAKREFRVGNLYINRGCTGALVQRHPFGGFKMSGVGSKAGGPDYLLQFMVPRNIIENTLRRGFAPPETEALPEK